MIGHALSCSITIFAIIVLTTMHLLKYNKRLKNTSVIVLNATYLIKYSHTIDEFVFYIICASIVLLLFIFHNCCQ